LVKGRKSGRKGRREREGEEKEDMTGGKSRGKGRNATVKHQQRK
jgi:hypothetical protein